MGFSNWMLNRANSISGNSSITVQATSPAFLDGEIRKMERKGYVRVGNPYTAVQYGKTTFYQSMALGVQQAKEDATKELGSQTNYQEHAEEKFNETAKKGNRDLVKIVGIIALTVVILFIILLIVSRVRIQQSEDDFFKDAYPTYIKGVER